MVSVLTHNDVSLFIVGFVILVNEKLSRTFHRESNRLCSDRRMFIDIKIANVYGRDLPEKKSIDCH